MVCSIFIASITASAWPRCTRSPGWARKEITLPGIGAVSRPPSAAPVAGMRDGVEFLHQALPWPVNTAKRSPCRYTVAVRRCPPRRRSCRPAPRACWPEGPALAADLQHRGAVVQPVHQQRERLAGTCRLSAGAARRRAAASRRGVTRGRRPPAWSRAPAVRHHGGGGHLHASGGASNSATRSRSISAVSRSAVAKAWLPPRGAGRPRWCAGP
jgi:hypothetical protein